MSGENLLECRDGNGLRSSPPVIATAGFFMVNMQALAYRKALARRPDWDRPIKAAVVEVCGNTGYNWFDI